MVKLHYSNVPELPRIFLIVFVLSVIAGYLVVAIGWTVIAVLGLCAVSVWFFLSPRSAIQVYIVLMASLSAINFQADFPIRLGADVALSSVLIILTILHILSRKPVKMAMPVKLLVVLIMLMGFSLLFTPDWVQGVSRTFRWISNLSLCILIPAYFSGKHDVYRLLSLILIAAFAPLAYALWGFAIGLDTLEVVGHRVSYRARLLGAGGPWEVGGFLLTVLAVSFSLIFYHRERGDWQKTWILLAFAILVVGGIISTFYRASWLGMLVIVLLVGRRLPRLALTSLTALGAVFYFIPAIWLRVAEVTQPTSNAHLRFQIWDWALNQLFSEPIRLLTGFGVAAYEQLAFVDVTKFNLSSAHNYYVEILFALGIPGFVTFAMLLISLIMLAWQIYRDYTEPIYRAASLALFLALSALSTMALTSSIFDKAVISFYFWALVAITLIIADGPSKKRSKVKSAIVLPAVKTHTLSTMETK